jgi:hypothetical protein
MPARKFDKPATRTAWIAPAALALGALLTGAGWSPAATATDGASVQTPRLDQRQANQAGRIRQGVQSGELTRAETRRLIHGQADLRRYERRAEADGEVTGRERARLHREADQQSRRIARQRHDRQDRD